MNERERYMLNALRVIASYGKEGKAQLRPYMIEHKLNSPWCKSGYLKQKIA